LWWRLRRLGFPWRARRHALGVTVGARAARVRVRNEGHSTRSEASASATRDLVVARLLRSPRRARLAPCAVRKAGAEGSARGCPRWSCAPTTTPTKLRFPRWDWFSTQRPRGSFHARITLPIRILLRPPARDLHEPSEPRAQASGCRWSRRLQALACEALAHARACRHLRHPAPARFRSRLGTVV